MNKNNHIVTSLTQFINEQKVVKFTKAKRVSKSYKTNEENTHNFDEWYFIAEKELRNITKNFDIDVDVDDGFDDNDHTECVTAAGGMEHYVIFKDNTSYEKNKSMFDRDSIIQIKQDKPIQLSTAIAFRTYTEDELDATDDEF